MGSSRALPTARLWLKFWVGAFPNDIFGRSQALYVLRPDPDCPILIEIVSVAANGVWSKEELGQICNSYRCILQTSCEKLNWSLLPCFGPLVNENALKAVVSRSPAMLSTGNDILMVSKWIPFFSANRWSRAVFPWGGSALTSDWMERAAQVQQPSCLCVFRTAFLHLAAPQPVSNLSATASAVNEWVLFHSSPYGHGAEWGFVLCLWAQ